VEEEGKDLMAVDGVMMQESLLPPWFWKAVLLALALLLLLFILWQTLFKSTIESAATEAVEDDVEQAELAADKAEEAAAVAQDAAGITTTVAGQEGTGQEGTGEEGTGEEGTGNEGTGDEGGPGGSTTTTTNGGGLQTALGTPLDFRLVASAAPAAPPGTANFPIDADNEFSLTDVLLQNPNGDSGRLAIMRDDQILYESALENFRDLDFHFVSPYEFAPGDRIVLQVTCDVAGKGATCSAAASFAGFVRPSS